jgi:hypothetical protein
MSKLDWYMRASLRPRHLQLLTALDDVRHVGRVAASLNVSQPAVSKSSSAPRAACTRPSTAKA